MIVAMTETHDAGGRPTLCVFSPGPILTVTIESAGGGAPEIHLHAGGQGFWVARMAAALGAEVTLCTALGGESGQVLRRLIESHDVHLVAVAADGPNGAYVHDRRTGHRDVVAEQPGSRLSRHEVDRLYGATVAAGLQAGVTLLTGPADRGTLPDEIYGRLASDLRRNGVRVLGDLSGGCLERALEAGLDVLKISDEELVAEGLSRSREASDVTQAVERLGRGSVGAVVVTREAQPAIGWLGGRAVAIAGPRFDPIEPGGAGDSLFAAVAVALAEGAPVDRAVRFGMAAGALNVTRRGLGSGDRDAIEKLLDEIDISPLDAAAGPGGRAASDPGDRGSPRRQSARPPTPWSPD